MRATPQLPVAVRQGWRRLTGPVLSLSERTPLRVKLIAALLVLATLALAATGVAGVVAMRGYLVQRLDQQVSASARSLARSISDYYTETHTLPQLTHTDPSSSAPAGTTGGTDRLAISTGYFVALVDLKGQGDSSLHKSTNGSAQTGPLLPTLDQAEVQKCRGVAFTAPASGAGHDWRVVAVPIVDNDTGQTVGSLAMALSLDDVDQTVGKLAVTELLVGLIVLTGLALLGYTLIRSSLRPLVRVEATAAAIAGGDLTRRVPQVPERTEVGRLSVALNGMLAQIETAFRGRAASEAEARASEARMRRFVADASHELRTPLTAIRGFAELMRHGAIESEMAADRIERAATRMSLLVDDLLLLARLDQQRSLESRPVDLLALVVDSVAEARVSFPDHPIELRIVRGAALAAPVGDSGLAAIAASSAAPAPTAVAFAGPVMADGLDDEVAGDEVAGDEAGGDGGDAPPVVRGDQAKLRQVIGNLITNACQHTPPGTPVTVTLGTTADRAVLEVADAGPGLRPEDAERVFERFYRVDAARNSASGGSGLGLSIVASIVAAHDGTVDVRSEPGEGACFSISLPLLS